MTDDGKLQMKEIWGVVGFIGKYGSVIGVVAFSECD
jgi:hypothetical protein